MSYYLKNLLNESEKRRILSLHENRKKYEWKGLIMEATQEEAQGFFDKRKTKMKNFPPNGTVIDYDGKGNFAYQITGTDGKPLYLFADGTAKDSVGNIAANRWYGQLSPDEVALDKMVTLKPTEIQTNTSPSTLTSTPSVTGSGPQNMMTGREISQSRKTLKRELKAAKKQLKKENKKNVQNCLAYFKNWEKDWNQKDEALQVIVKETSPNYKSYVNFLSSCCNILTENGKQPALVGLCSTKGVEPETVLGSGPTSPVVNPTGTQGAPNAGPQNMPGMSGKSGSGMGRLSAEDQELRDLGLQ